VDWGNCGRMARLVHRPCYTVEEIFVKKFRGETGQPWGI
jgi:hypothetical protein